ncbi:hypothetical protein E4U30_006909 [Claviceps sp. LM220 group G6]|nr:hypothetical protein E4U30_006909 [Claviceps sp. LM220 group G6]
MGILSADLPQLDQIEEWLIARIHVHIQVWTYRRSQYRYKGHDQHQQIPLRRLDRQQVSASSQDSQPTASPEGPPVMRIPSIRQAHIISFLKDAGTVNDTLPLLSSELDTIV